MHMLGKLVKKTAIDNCLIQDYSKSIYVKIQNKIKEINLLSTSQIIS